MMKALRMVMLLVLVLVPVIWGIHQAEAATYLATINYRERIVKLLEESQFQGWPSGAETAGRHIEEVVAHREGTPVAFTVKLDIYSDKRLYVYGNGTQLVDCTPYLNAAGINPSSVYGLRWSHEGNRLFFLVANTYDMYYLVPWFIWKVYPAFKGVPDQGWVPWPYSVNYEGTRIFFKGVLNHEAGLYYVNVGDSTYTLHPMMLMSQLPGPQNWNVLRFLGASWEGGSLLCTYFGSAAGNSIAMWRVPTPSNPPNPSQAPVKVPNEEHTWVWAESDPNKIIDSGIGTPEGHATALYTYQDSGNEMLYYVDLISGEKRQLLSADGGIYLFPTLLTTGPSPGLPGSPALDTRLRGSTCSPVNRGTPTLRSLLRVASSMAAITSPTSSTIPPDISPAIITWPAKPAPPGLTSSTWLRACSRPRTSTP
jgi:hypothetical protein